MMKKTILATMFGLLAIGSGVAEDKMYLVKEDHVVAKYDVDAVDYISFQLPEGVVDENIWFTIDKVGKNSVTYTVNTVGSDVAYAHNLLSYWDVEYMAQSMYGESIDDLSEETLVECLQLTLSYDAFVGIGKAQFTLNDFQQYDPSSEAYRFVVTPGTEYYLCAWQIDPVNQEPLETFVYTTLSTNDPEEVDLNLNVTRSKITQYGMVLDFTGSSDILYVRTAWGMAKQMDAYVDAYGLDSLMGMFGQNWSMDFLAGTGDLAPDVENATWPVEDPGDYKLFVRAYDMEGNMQEATFTFSYVSEAGDDVPVITITNRDKGDGVVSLTFDITPKDVEEAYVRLMDENTVDDRINAGYTYPEIAAGGDATDITSDINSKGSYTYENRNVPERWNSILIYAKSKSGGVTTLRVNFYPDTDTTWSVYKPFHAPAKRISRAIRKIHRAGDPTLSR